MDLPEQHTHSFIVKIWLEETVAETNEVVWRGHVTHVPSGTRRYLKDLDALVDFITGYLMTMGVRLPAWQRARRRLRHGKRLWGTRR